MSRRLWERDEMILALELYHKLPFGRLNHSTPEVKELATLINRTPSSVALRLVNYASCDPLITSSGRSGMSGGYEKCLPYWTEFQNDIERLFLLAAKLKAAKKNKSIEEELSLTDEDFTGHEKERVIRQRIGQSAFHDMILANYNSTCAITGINIPELLVASHIIPWAANEEMRLNPSNGICLSPLYDKVFDLGFIGIRPDDYTIILSKELKENKSKLFFDKHFKNIENQQIILPHRAKPNQLFLQYHLDEIFAKHE